MKSTEKCNKMRASYFHDLLPDELLQHIFTFLDFQFTSTTVSSVCKRHHCVLTRLTRRLHINGKLLPLRHTAPEIAHRKLTPFVCKFRNLQHLHLQNVFVSHASLQLRVKEDLLDPLFQDSGAGCAQLTSIVLESCPSFHGEFVVDQISAAERSGAHQAALYIELCEYCRCGACQCCPAGISHPFVNGAAHGGECAADCGLGGATGATGSV